MSNKSTFKISGPRVIHETIGGNTLVINLENGHYYSLSLVGSAIWGHLMSGASLSLIAENFFNIYQVNATQFMNDLEQFVSNLRDEGILVENEDQESIPNASLSSQLVNEVKKYEAPHFIKFTDMEALLLADPIHELLNES